jgi:hypothetical protein
MKEKKQGISMTQDDTHEDRSLTIPMQTISLEFNGMMDISWSREEELT